MEFLDFGYVRPILTDSEPFVEFDTTGRYDTLLGVGSVKKVYLGFDIETGIEVAWNQVKFNNFSANKEEMMDSILSEVRLLRILKSENLIPIYGEWTDKKDDDITLNFVTEHCTSGNLRQYRHKHRRVSLKAIKRWCKQILKGLEYLHMHEPCIIHRDLNCSNVFVNGNSGQVKIGDFGTAAVVGKNHVAHSILGTPEFMAPELYEEEYTEMVDIYSFGLCVLELMTLEIPYNECDTVANIYKKVTFGVRPEAMNKVKNLQVKDFIERCLGQPRNRPSASDLLADPFFDGIEDDENNNNLSSDSKFSCIPSL